MELNYCLYLIEDFQDVLVTDPQAHEASQSYATHTEKLAAITGKVL